MDPSPSLIRYPGLIYEVLITTNNIKSTKDANLFFNVAPMGIIFKDKNKFIIQPYKTSKTYQNLLKNNYFGINFSSDASLFYKCVYNKDKFVNEDFNIISSTNTPFLNTAIYHGVQLIMIAKKIKEIPASKERAKFECILETEIFLKNKYEPWCRANNLALEAVVHSTRINILKDSKKKEELKNLIYQYNLFVKKTAKNTIFEEILDKIIIKIKDL